MEKYSEKYEEVGTVRGWLLRVLVAVGIDFVIELDTT